MRRLLFIGLLSLAACGPKAGAKHAKDDLDADSRSGPDGKRSTAQRLALNQPHTDEVNYANQDRTDWYVVDLQGRPGVLTTIINWDNVNSDVNIDVFDAFGAQISASPVRGRGEKQKKLFTQIDKPGTYYVRVTAPTKADGTVYTMEAQWEEPPVQMTANLPPPTPPPPPPPPVEERPRRHERTVHEPREPREPRERPSGETVEARVVTAYRQGNSLVMYIDKGSAAGIHPGDSGIVLQGSGGEEPLEGGQFRITRVIDANKCVGMANLRSLGKNNRVAITLGR